MIRVLLAALFLFVGGAAQALPVGSGARDPSIVIGVVATLSGPGAIAGQDLVDGFNLALKQLGGRFANQEVRVVVADDRGSPDVARQQVQKLLERERLDMVLTGVSTGALAAIVKPLVESHLFVLNLEEAPAAMAGAECSSYLFQVAATAEGMHEAMGTQLNTDKVRRLVVVGTDTAVTDEAVAALKRSFTGEVVAVLKVRPGATMFQKELDAIAQARPDAVYSVLAGGTGVGFVRAYGASGQKAERPLYADWRGMEKPLLAAMGDAALDVVNIASWSPDLDSIPNKRMMSDHDSEFGRMATTWTAQGYDAAFLLDAALKATNGRTGDSDALRNALRRAEFVSVRGGFKFNTNQFPVVSYYLRKVTRDAKGRLTNEFRGVVAKDWRDRRASACPMRWAEEPAPAVKKP